MLLSYIRDELGGCLPDDLVAAAEESVIISTPLSVDRRIPDVGVVDQADSWKKGESSSWVPEEDAAVLARLVEPMVAAISNDDTARWVEIRTLDGGHLVTAIEILSPSNKTLEGRPVFDQKVKDYLSGGANVIEIDLVRGGRSRDFTVQRGEGERTPCNIFVISPNDPNFAKVYPCPLRQNLPAIRVPLRTEEPEIILDLQPLVDRCYTLGRYWSLDHTKATKPALEEEDHAWATKLWRDRLSK